MQQKQELQSKTDLLLMENFFYRLVLPPRKAWVGKLTGEDRDWWGNIWSSVQGGGTQRISDTFVGSSSQVSGYRITKVSCLVSGSRKICVAEGQVSKSLVLSRNAKCFLVQTFCTMEEGMAEPKAPSVHSQMQAWWRMLHSLPAVCGPPPAPAFPSPSSVFSLLLPSACLLFLSLSRGFQS